MFALGAVTGALLVADEDMRDGVLLDDLVIDREHGPAGIAENMLHALVLERRRAQRQEPGRVQLGGHVREHELDRLVLRDRNVERLADFGIVACFLVSRAADALAASPRMSERKGIGARVLQLPQSIGKCDSSALRPAVFALARSDPWV